MKYVIAAVELAVTVAIAGVLIFGIWWAIRDTNAPTKQTALELVVLGFIVTVIGALAWTAIDYAVIKNMR